MRELDKNRAVLPLVVLTAVAAGALIAQVFPVRLDEPVDQLAPVGFGGSISAYTVQLRVLAEPPFPCDAAALGHLYLQQDFCFPGNDEEHLCICRSRDSGSVIDWHNVHGSSPCDIYLAASCPP